MATAESVQSKRAAADDALLDPSARLQDGESATEHWDLTVRLDGGYFVWARFLITSIGPGEKNGLVIGSLVTPEGVVQEFRDASDWQVDPDGRGLRVRDCQFEMRPPRYRFHVEENDVRVTLEFEPNGRVPTPEAARLAGYGYDLLASATPVTGSIWAEGMAAPRQAKGRAALIHAFTEGSEWESAVRRIELFSIEPDGPLHWVELLGPDGARRSWLLYADASGRIHSRTDAAATLEGAKDLIFKPSADYWVPEALVLTSGDGDAGVLKGRVALGRIAMEHDPLGDIPQPFRWMLSFRMKPHRVWTDARYTLAVEGAPSRQGEGVAVVTFVNPVPRP